MQVKMIRPFLGLLVLAVLLPRPGWAEPLRVVATLPSLAALAQAVGGARVAVEALSSPRQDPHFVDARPDRIVALHRADLLVVNGLDLEIGWLPVLVTQARNPKIRAGLPGHLDASRFVPLLRVPTGPVDRGMGDVHPGGNPHFLLDPRAAALVAKALAVRLGQLDPPGAPTYAAQAQALADRLTRLAADARARCGRLPPGLRKVVAYHDSLPYLTDWLGLQQVTTVEPKPGIPPDPAHTAAVLGAMKAQGVKTLIQEEFYPRTTSATLARLAGGRLVLLPGGARFAEGQGYEAHAAALADEVCRAP